MTTHQRTRRARSSRSWKQSQGSEDSQPSPSARGDLKAPREPRLGADAGQNLSQRRISFLPRTRREVSILLVAQTRLGPVLQKSLRPGTVHKAGLAGELEFLQCLLPKHSFRQRPLAHDAGEVVQ